MVHPGDVVDGRAELHRQREPLDDVARVPRHDVDAADPSRLPLEDELVEDVLRLDELRALDAVVLGRLELEPLGLRLLLGQARLPPPRDP